MTSLTATPANTPELLKSARALLAEIERQTGVSPISDQAMVAVANGERELLLFHVHEPETSEGPVGAGVVGGGEVDLALMPAYEALAPDALAALLAAAADAGSGTNSATELRAWVHGERPEFAAALKARGFHPARSLFRMALDPARLPPATPGPFELEFPAGLTLREFGSTGDVDADAAAWVAANAAAFASHPEQGRITVSDFAEMRREPWFDASDLLLLDSGSSHSQLAASTWVKTLGASGTDETSEASDTACELYAVGVRPEFAGKGLGKLLLEATLRRMAQHGASSVSLYVDGDNTPAVSLYEKRGFTIDSRSTQWLLSPSA